MRILLLTIFVCVQETNAQTDSLVSVFIHSNYVNASIRIDDQETGLNTPALISGVKIGHRKVTLKWNYLLVGTEYAAEKIVEVKHDRDSFYVEFKPVTVGIVCNAQKTELYLNGRLKGEGSDIVLDSIIPGTYTMRIKQPFGIIAEKKVFFAPNNSDCPVECFVFGNLHVTSDELDNVPVFLNGKKTDQAIPAVFPKLLVGEYEASIKAKGKTYSKKIIVKADEDVFLKINPKDMEREAREQEKMNAELQKEQKKILLVRKKEEDKLFNFRKEQLRNTIDSIEHHDNKLIYPQNTAKINLSLHAGINYALYSSVSDGFGYNTGLSISMSVFKSIQFRSDLSFNTKKFLCSADYDKKTNLYYIDVGVMVKILFFKRFYAVTGPGYERNVNTNKISYDYHGGRYDLSKPYCNLYFYTIKLGYDFVSNANLEFSYTKNTSGLSQVLTKKMRTYNMNIGFYFMNF